MAKIVEETVVIKFSRLIKTGESDTKEKMTNADMISALEQVAQELVGENVVVEVEDIK